jgi:hypothetical protein
VLLVHGDADAVVIVHGMYAAIVGVQAVGIPVQSWLRPGRMTSTRTASHRAAPAPSLFAATYSKIVDDEIRQAVSRLEAEHAAVEGELGPQHRLDGRGLAKAMLLAGKH